MDYQEQYQNYLAQAMAALETACARFLPEESEVCRAARYSLMGGGKADPRSSGAQRLRYAGRRVCRRHSSLQLLWKCCTAIRSSTMTCPAWTMMICAAAVLPATRRLARQLPCWPVMCC